MNNKGILLRDPKPTDYRYAGVTFVPNKRTVLDWSPSLPDGALQKTTSSDMMDCVTFMTQAIETQVNLEIEKGNFRQEALDYFTEAGYMDNGKFNLSERYNATLNGTTFEGQYIDEAADHICAKRYLDGLLPYKDLPMTPNMTWGEYYAPVPQNLIDKAKKIYDYFSVKWHWVDPANIPEVLLNAPVMIATSVCPGWGTDSPVKMCGGPCQHITMVYGEDDAKNYLIFDHYEPFKKKLASNYHIFAAMQIVIEPALPPKLWQKLLAFFKK